MGPALVFDVSGVITGDRLPLAVARMVEPHGIEFERAWQVIHREIYPHAAVGRMTAKEMHEKAARRLELPLTYEQFAAAYLEGYPLRSTVLDFVRSLVPRHRLFVLSNQTEINTLSLRPLLERNFERMLFSNEVGRRKPDRAIYRMLFDGAGLQPEQCVFIDDRMENLAPAEAEGMKALHYTSFGKLKADLRALGVRAD